MTPAPVSHPDTPATDGAVLPLPPRVPRRRANRFARWAGQTILRLGGWRMAGAIADEPKVVLIGAPEASARKFDLLRLHAFLAARGAGQALAYPALARRRFA